MLPGLIDLATETVRSAIAGSDHFVVPKGKPIKAADPVLHADEYADLERRAMLYGLIDPAYETVYGAVIAASGDFVSPKKNPIESKSRHKITFVRGEKVYDRGSFAPEPKGQPCYRA